MSRSSRPEARRLHAPGTYLRTQRLMDLLAGGPEGGAQPTQDEMLELWRTYRKAEGYTGVHSSLTEFAHWVIGDEDPEMGPCEVVW